MALSEADAIKLKARLWAEAREKFPADPDRQRIYVFGTLRKRGWKPQREK